MKINDYLFLILKYLKTKKLRTFLTSLGITIGIATIFTLIALSQGLQYYVQSELNKFGNKAIFIFPGARAGFVSSISGYFTNSFIENIKTLPGVERVIKAYSTSTIIKYNNYQIPADVLVINTNDINYLTYVDYNILEGTFITNNNNCQVDLGYQIANSPSLNNQKISVGDYINIFGQRCQVVGILQQTSGNPDYTILFPEGEYEKIFGNINYNYLIVIVYNYNIAYNSINNYINSLKGQTYTIVTAQSIEQIADQIIGGISMFSLIIASISILISAINIVNTMYTSILERYREIGLLKALGMKNIEVLVLFLLESGFIGLLGGILGIMLGFFTSYIASSVLKFYGFIGLQPYINVQLIIFSLVFPFFIGILSGTLPAIKASRIDPMVALRYE
ncbi:ABC transporter permease [Candidatus Nanobsidianus stetteri]|uniref:ABC transporter permease n=1 Tax=Nanobsidianus stetteri TaxID=1294122 RepID=A0A2T9WM01_NANST|nr:ABC transporter permease [Candidatus Nanobsidianus stetteri]MCC5446849.1 ABC transporter permease [Candidatus Nanobsidianus stetteri]